MFFVSQDPRRRSVVGSSSGNGMVVQRWNAGSARASNSWWTEQQWWQCATVLVGQKEQISRTDETPMTGNPKADAWPTLAKPTLANFSVLEC